MLKKQKMRFHLTSCHLPKLQSMERTTKNTNYNSSGSLSSGKHCKQLKSNVNKKSLLNDRLELKGNGMEISHHMNEFVNGNGNLPEHCDTNFDKEMFGKEQFLQDRDIRVQSHYSHSSMDLSPESNRPLSNKTLFIHKQYVVDIPVSLPNPALTDESCSIVSEARDLNSEIISLELKTEKFNKTSDEEKNAPNEIKCSPDNIDKSERKLVVPVEIPCNDLRKERLTKRESNTGSGFTPSESCEDRLPSRLTYTPSTTPLFLSEEIYELPKGVSPSKALLELRQTFCENIRKETEQLEFDLQQLYLKKQLHQR
jgi:hypothetical protein